MRARRRMWIYRCALLGVILWVASGLGAGAILTARWSGPYPEPAPALEGARVSAHRIETDDGEVLGAWLAETSTRSEVVVLLLHGNRASRTDNRDLLELLVQRGLPVLALTFRAHGDSSGRHNDFGLGASRDVLAAARYLERKLPGRRLIVVGRSLGAAAALFAAPGLRAAGYVLESPFSDLDTAARNRTEIYLVEPFSSIAHGTLMLFAPLFLGQTAASISPERAARGVAEATPMLILAGDRDRRARPEEAQAIAAAAGPRTRVVRFPGARHGTLLPSDPGRYETALFSLISEAISR